MLKMDSACICKVSHNLKARPVCNATTPIDLQDFGRGHFCFARLYWKARTVWSVRSMAYKRRAKSSINRHQTVVFVYGKPFSYR